MRYMLLMIAGSEAFDAMSADQKKAFDAATRAYDEGLMASGKFIDANALWGPDEAKTVRRRKSRAVVTDGPFAETKEHLCGYIMVDVADEVEALELAEQSPFAELGAVDVRKVMVLD